MWLSQMNDELRAFFSENVAGLAAQLDFSGSSLDVLEEWMLSKYSSVDELVDPSQKAVLDRTARYVGETIRKQYNLQWKIELKKKDDAYFGLPVMTDEKGKVNYECPHSLVTATVDRRENGYLRMVFDAVMI